MLPPLGLFSWLLMGLAAGLLGAWLLPGRPPLSRGLAAAAGVGGALFGGLLATVLGFGGLVGWDLRGQATATLGAVLCLLLVRLWRLQG